MIEAYCKMKGKANLMFSSLTLSEFSFSSLSLSLDSLIFPFNNAKEGFNNFISHFHFVDDKTGTLDGALDNLYCRAQMYLSRQMSRLRPELTMPIFSGLNF